MGRSKGMIVLMGSGEMTSTMVEVHKELLSRYGGAARAVFIDTPAGFQLNVDQLSEKAVEYFRTRILHGLDVVSYKSTDTISSYDAEKAFRMLREADYFLVGPGSPTYAVRQWENTPVPGIITSRIEAGGCLVAASAAALTVGRFTLPVYEIYKVGEPLQWVKGTNILGAFGINVVVVPHWNNAEGGNHDTRFCYMGELRFNQLESQLPADTGVVGLDEHTACLIDLQNEAFTVRGLGRVIIRRGGVERYFQKGDAYPLSLLHGDASEESYPPLSAEETKSFSTSGGSDDSFWHTVNKLHRACQEGLERGMHEKAVTAMLELDGIIWKAQEDLESQEFISQAREILREMVVCMGTALDATTKRVPEHWVSLLDGLVSMRTTFRHHHRWEDADAIRECLLKIGIHIQDTREGSTWFCDPDVHAEQ